MGYRNSFERHRYVERETETATDGPVDLLLTDENQLENGQFGNVESEKGMVRIDCNVTISLP